VSLRTIPDRRAPAPGAPEAPAPSGRLLLAAALALSLSVPAVLAQGPGGDWVPQGPAPTVFGQVENVTPDDEVVGAIHTVAAHPTDPNVLFVGTVNGGIWRTANATALRPSWTRLTDRVASNSIGALEYDPTDPQHRTLVAGVGLYSSYARLGGARTGLFRTTNAGSSWIPITGSGILLGKNISGVAARGSTLVVSVDVANAFTFGNIGIWRSTNGGVTFTQIAQGNGAATGLPGGVTHDLVGDPNNPARLFTSVVFANLVGGQNGVYRSDDTGATWTKVSSPAMDSLLISGGTSNVEFAVGRHGNVYAAIANSGRLAGFFRSGDGGATWTAMDLPRTVEAGGAVFGIHPGGQASIHMSVVADPTDANIVYVGGDRQPFFTEGGGSGPFFPNSIGAENFSGRLFRGDASQPSGSQWVHLTHRDDLGAPGGGTASNSSPHADSREMTFDAAGVLVEVDDGGIYRRTQPRSAAGDWFSVNGDLAVTEIHDGSYDRNSDVHFSGNQDNGTTYQVFPENTIWTLWVSGDGGDVQIDDSDAPGGVSIRYSSAQGLQVFNRSFWDADNNNLGFVIMARQVLDGGAPLQPQFTTPVQLNAVEPERLLIAGANSLYESLDQGDTIREIGPGVFAVGIGRQPLAYGHPDNPDVIYSGDIDSIAVRTGPQGSPVVNRPSFPGTGTGLTIRGIAIDPLDHETAYVANGNDVYVTTDAGVTWSSITGDLASTGALFPNRALVFVDRAGTSNDLLVVATSNGVFHSKRNDGFLQWKRLGSADSLPTVPVFDLEYDAEADVLNAGTLGRGTFRLEGLGSSQ
jgi:hypothetical protein